MFTGIRSLLGSGVYTEAYPLHDVGNIIILLFFYVHKHPFNSLQLIVLFL